MIHTLYNLTHYERFTLWKDAHTLKRHIHCKKTCTQKKNENCAPKKLVYQKKHLYCMERHAKEKFCAQGALMKFVH